jgi:hypothetical protein
MDVEIIGGPDDGAWIALPDGNSTIKFALPPTLSLAKLDLSDPDVYAPLPYTEVSCPIRLTREGYRAYWSERT